MDKPKILIIVGPTASGKSDLAVSLAKKFNGEIISADSRQVYKGFNIGSGKITKKEMGGIKHHLLDVADPKRDYTVARFKRDARKSLKEILRQNKLPIIAGGTGLYIDALVYNTNLPPVPPNKTLRTKLEKKSAVDLYQSLRKIDPKRAKALGDKNKRKLIRAIEIASVLGKVPKLKIENQYDVLWIGIKPDQNSLKEKINNRLISRLKKGMISEVRKLHESGISWKRLENFGLEYRYISYFLQGKISKEQMIEKLNTEIWRYSKRQMRWFKRNRDINWLKPSKKLDIEASKILEEFVTK